MLKYSKGEFPMRKVLSVDIHGLTVDDALERFNEDPEMYMVNKEADIISISTRSAVPPVKIAQPDGSVKESKVIVTVFYWSGP
jgi:hypothetical protein